MTTGGRHRALGGALAAAFAVAGVTLVACSAFTSTDPSAVLPAADGGGAGDGTSAADGGSPFDATGAADAATEAALATDAGTDAADGGPMKLVFVLPNKLGAVEVAGADLACAALRPGAIAWTSKNGSGPLARLNGNGPWAQPDGRVVFKNRAALSGSVLDAAINRDLDGNVASGLVWTGVRDDGSPATFTCQGWSTTTANGTVGELGVTTAAWTNNLVVEPCTATYPVICFESD